MVLRHAIVMHASGPFVAVPGGGGGGGGGGGVAMQLVLLLLVLLLVCLAAAINDHKEFHKTSTGLPGCKKAPSLRLATHTVCCNHKLFSNLQHTVGSALEQHNCRRCPSCPCALWTA